METISSPDIERPERGSYDSRDSGGFEDALRAENPTDRKRNALDRHRYFSTCGRYIYHISIIDYLTQFNTSKKIESFFKVTVKNNNEYLVSAVNPDLYGHRFEKFMQEEVIINEELKSKENIEMLQ